jgi:hypothetical protein
MIGFPYFWFLEGLGPAVEFLGYVALVTAILLGWISWPFIAAFLILAFVFGIVLSLASVALEEMVFRRYSRNSDFIRLMVLAVLENVGYRQIVTFWRMKGVVSSLLGKKTWGDMDRRGFQRDPEPVVSGVHS